MQAFQADAGALGEAVAHIGAAFGAALRQIGRWIVEVGVGAAQEQVAFQLAVGAVGVKACGAARQAGFFHLRRFDDDDGFFIRLDAGVDAHQAGRGGRVAVFDGAGADFDVAADLVLGSDTADQEARAVLVDFVRQAQADRVQVFVQARHRGAQQDAAAERIDVVVDVAHQGAARQDHAGLVAVTHDDFDALAVDDHQAAAGEERARGAVGGEFFDHLARAVVAEERVDRQTVQFGVLAQARQVAVVGAQVARRGHAWRHEVAEHHVRAVALGLDVQAAGRLRLEAAARVVAVGRVERKRVDVAEHLRFGVLVRVVRHGQQRIGADLALGEHRGAGAGIDGLAPGHVAQAVFEAVEIAQRGRGIATAAVQAEGAFDDAGRHHRAQGRQEAQRVLRAQQAAGGLQAGFAGVRRRAQREFGAAAFDEDLVAWLAWIEVGLVPLAGAGVQRDRGAFGDQHAIRVFQAHRDHRQRAAIGRRGFDQRGDRQARQGARHDDVDDAAAARVAEAVGLAHFDQVVAGFQGHADIVAQLERLRRHRVLLADMAVVHGHAIDQQREARTGAALDADRRLGVRQDRAVDQADEAQAVGHRGQVQLGRGFCCGRAWGGQHGGRGQHGAQAGGPGLDRLEHVGIAAAQREIGARQFAVLQVDEAAAGVARIAVRQHGQLTGQHRAQVDFRHVGARGNVGEAVAAIGIGLRKAAVFQVDAHVGDARLAQVALAVDIAVGEHVAQDEALAAEDAGFDLDFGRGHRRDQGQRGAAGGLGAVDAVALQRAAADAHAVAQHAVRPGGQRIERDAQRRAAVLEPVGHERAIDAQRARHE